MTTKTLLLLLLVASSVAASFTQTNPHQDGRYEGVPAGDASIRFVESVRGFRIDNAEPVGVYVSLTGNEGEDTYLTEEGYAADVYLSTDDGATWTQVASDVNSTDPSASLEMTSSHEPALRVVLHFPAQRSVRVVDVALLVSLQDASTGSQNGGVQDSSFRHTVHLNFYDGSSDADGDGLPDAWEYQHFENLDQGPADDPDGDGLSNQAEYDGGTDPIDSDNTEGTGPGGGGVMQAGVGWIAAIGYLVLASALVLAIAISRRFDHRIIALGGWFAILWTLASVALWLLEVFAPGKGWIPWAYPQWSLGPAFWSIAVASAVLGGAALAMTRQGQRRQQRTAALAGAFVVLMGGALLYVGWLQVPTIFTA